MARFTAPPDKPHPDRNSCTCIHNLELTFTSLAYKKLHPLLKSKKVKASSYIAQYLILRIAQSTLHFTFLADLFNQTSSQLLWEASNHMLQLIREDCCYTYAPLSIARYSFI